MDLGADIEEDPLAFERAHVVVYLEVGSKSEIGSKSAGASAGAPSKVAAMEQKDRRFVPDLVVIPAGATVSFPNFDPIFHDVFSLSKAKNFDLGNYPKGQTRLVAFPTAGVVAVYCHLHPNMSASIVVTPSLVAWHKTAGTFRKAVEIGSAGDGEVNFALPYVDPAAGNHISHR